MVEKNGVYKCEVCGNVVSIVIGVDIPIECCNQDMNLVEPKGEAEEGKEKHVPIIEKTDNGIKVKVGSVEHPMEDSHYIALIQVLRGDDVIFEKHLRSNEKPEADFVVESADGLTAREYCNMHGLWTS